ncbi:MinD/ParA family protein [Paenibacillus thailandensis]|uniref:MinD/ParA family protein n=1 Tax=Paenibacillus thailandensis TaxID=393250 RepID=A0ABW5QXI7_9BACL
MNDQAEALRSLIRSKAKVDASRRTRLVTVTSGKGGVGKSNFSLNFALTLQKLGRRTLLFDADIGMANIDVLLGVSAPYSMYHLFRQEKTIHELIQEGPGGIRFVAGGSGLADLLDVSPGQLRYAAEQIESLQGQYDYILFDTGAGLGKEAIKFMEASQETIVVTTPEPTAITDAYALIKMVKSLNIETGFKLVVNRAMDGREGKHTLEKMVLAAERFLQTSIQEMGVLPEDAFVTKAVRKQQPFSLAYPGSPAARALEQMTRRYMELPYKEKADGLKGFIHKMFGVPR